ncbi:unnamed protein product [Clonostachys rosea]|uniref:Pyrroloquinoline quinone-dependent pyranose dehydrogenase beta-propeller domain-containing protein n=1 Tax=Bionectria ochroleuca TaxID=29856 RepID=A0ABY6UCY9_BIOOC|nr:unnamed protein product [Clonostachys rosea]
MCRKSGAMVKRALPFLVVAGLLSAVLAADCANILTFDYPTPVVADDWSFRLVANGFTRPRGLIFDKDGGLLVVDSGVGLIHLTLKDDGGTCLSVSEKRTLIGNRNLNHGVALSADGSAIYVSTSDQVLSWGYNSTSVQVTGTSRTLVKGMDSSGHTTRTLLVSQKQPGLLLVSRGSDGNVDMGTLEIDSGRSQIRSFNLSLVGQNNDGINYTDGNVVGWGLRNSVGVAEHPSTGGIWSVENSVDQLQRQGEDIHNDNPGEELNYHGTAEKPDGRNYGYPSCFTLWRTDDFPNLGSLKTGNSFAVDDAENGVNDTTCNEDFISPRLALPPHTAPLDIKFTDDGSTAYVSFHGSWNRDEPAGYRVASIAFKDGQPTAANDSQDASVDLLTNADLSKCPGSCFRPVGLAFDSKKRLWLTSDSTGELLVLERSGNSSGNGNSNDTGSGSSDNDSAASRYWSSSAIDGMMAMVFVAIAVMYLS